MAVRRCAERAIQSVLDDYRPAVVAFDTETTGLRGAVVQAALVELDAHGVERDVFVGIVAPPPGYRMEAGAVRVHGITPERIAHEGVAAGPFFAELTHRLKRARDEGKRIVAHNAAFDEARLNETLAAHGVDGGPVGGVFCTMRSAKRHCGLVDRRGAPRCPKNAELYALLHGRDAAELGGLHDAAVDARVTAHAFLEGRRRGWWR